MNKKNIQNNTTMKPIKHSNQMKQQTAVEWLQEAISNKLTNEISPSFLDLFDQAKAIEKQQIIDGVYAGYNYDGARLEERAEQYYNENYGKN